VTDFVQAHPQGIILAMDQMSLYFQATLTRVWAPVGHTPIVRITPNRDHGHFYGALDGRHGREIAIPTDEETTAMTVNFLRVLLMLFPTQDLLLVLDRAPWHFGPELDQRLADTDRLELVYFPPACPELNPQEPVWEQAREASEHNHDFRQFAPLIDAFESYLNETPFDIGFMEHYAPPILCEV
jgi:transposase